MNSHRILNTYSRRFFLFSYLAIISLFLFFVNSSIAQTSFEISNFEKNKFLNYKSNFYYDSDTNIDVKYYKIFLDVKINPNYLYGEVIISGIVINPADSIFFDLSNIMFVDSIRYNGNPISFNHYKDKISIHPNKSNFRNINFSVIIYYRGIPTQTGFGSFVFGNNNNTPVVWSLSEPFGASDWFPCKNTPSDKADSSDIWIKCNSLYTGISNGILTEVLINQDSTKTYKWKNSYPIANYLLSVAVTNYSLYTNYFKYSSADSMPVLHYIYPEVIDSLKPTLYKTVKMLEIFSNKFGLYPFIREKYGHAQTGTSGAMEHQTATSIGVINEYIIAHELGHQWFGDKITCRDWHHIWLNEGFATYSECIYIEEMYGKIAFDQSISTKMADARKAIGTIYVQNINSISEIFDPFRSYAKGGMVLHMLRGVVGDTTFFNILKAYSSDTTVAYKTAVTEDFKKVAERVSGIQLGYFFNEWIYGENYPVYFISWTYNQKEDDIYSITLEVNQKQNSNPQFFTMPLDVKVNTSFGDTTLHFFNNSLKQIFIFDVKGIPKLITLDPENRILKDKYGDDPIIIVGYSLEQNYPNPFNPNTTIKYEVAGYVEVKISVYDVLGRIQTILVKEKQKPGKYAVSFSGRNFASGVYFYKIEVNDPTGRTGNFTDVKKMVLIR